MTVPMTLPSVDQLHAYLRFKGWQELSPGPVGSVWTIDHARIGVPHEDDDELVLGAVKRVARAEGRSLKEVSDSVRFMLFDVTHLRAVNNHQIAETIPLEAAATILSSAKRMFQATATTARSERAQIAGNFSKLGNEVVKHALMGHTENGSFVIPVLVELPEPSPIDVHELDLWPDASFHRAAPEPFERRVVRTFAQSLHAVQEIVEPAKDPSVDQIYELVYRGVSREFCTSLSGILSEPSVAQFGATVEWAAAVTPSVATSTRTSIDSDAVDLVKRIANRLRQQRVDPNQIFSGTIVQLRHEEPDDPFGEVAISTVRRGRQSEVLVRLPFPLYRDAWTWHSEGRAVLVEGVVRKAPSHPLRVDSPVRFHPVDEMLLPTD